MRVWLVHQGDDLYGSGRVLLSAANALSRDHLVTVMLPGEGALSEALRGAPRIQVLILDPVVLRMSDLRSQPLFRVLRTLWRARASTRTLAAQVPAPDVVYTSCATVFGGMILARKWGIPHVWHVHEIFGRNWPQRIFLRLGLEPRLRSSATVIVPSRAAANQFKSGLRPRVRVVASGARLSQLDRTAHPLQAESVRCVLVGRFNAVKGQQVAIEALSVLRERGIPVTLTLVGGYFGSQSHYLTDARDLARKLGIEEFVEFAGQVAEPETILLKSDIALVPSVLPESFGMAVVEAMSLGLPVIASNIGALSEVVEHEVNGLLVRAGSVNELAAAIERLFRDRDQALALARRGSETAQRFNLADSAEIVARIVTEASQSQLN